MAGKIARITWIEESGGYYSLKDTKSLFLPGASFELGVRILWLFYLAFPVLVIIKPYLTCVEDLLYYYGASIS